MEHHGPKPWLLSLPFIPEAYRTEAYVHVIGASLVFLMITVFSVLAYFRIRNRREKYLVPESNFSLVSVIDLLAEGLYNTFLSVLGHHGEKHIPFVAAIFIFVLLSNLLGILPQSASPSTSLNTTLALGLASFLYYNVMGIREHGFLGYLKHFLMGLGIVGIPIALFELLSHVLRPFTLGLRLFLNLSIDHLLAGSFSDLCKWFLPVPLLLFGVVVCTIQAFLFATLTCVYLQMATEHEQH